MPSDAVLSRGMNLRIGLRQKRSLRGYELPERLPFDLYSRRSCAVRPVRARQAIQLAGARNASRLVALPVGSS